VKWASDQVEVHFTRHWSWSERGFRALKYCGSVLSPTVTDPAGNPLDSHFLGVFSLNLERNSSKSVSDGFCGSPQCLKGDSGTVNCLWRRYINIAIEIVDIVRRSVFYLKHDVSETGFCVRLQLVPTKPELIDGFSPCLWSWGGDISVSEKSSF
jgi:hypothetical protein